MSVCVCVWEVGVLSVYMCVHGLIHTAPLGLGLWHYYCGTVCCIINALGGCCLRCCNFCPTQIGGRHKWHTEAHTHLHTDTHTHAHTYRDWHNVSFTHSQSFSLAAAGGGFCYEWKSLLKIFLQSIFHFPTAHLHMFVYVCYAWSERGGGGTTTGSWHCVCLHK